MIIPLQRKDHKDRIASIIKLMDWLLYIGKLFDINVSKVLTTKESSIKYWSFSINEQYKILSFEKL